MTSGHCYPVAETSQFLSPAARPTPFPPSHCPTVPRASSWPYNFAILSKFYKWGLNLLLLHPAFLEAAPSLELRGEAWTRVLRGHAQTRAPRRAPLAGRRCPSVGCPEPSALFPPTWALTSPGITAYTLNSLLWPRQLWLFSFLACDLEESPSQGLLEVMAQHLL